MENIFHRVSIRKYEDKPVEKEKIPPHSPEASEYHGPTPYDP